MLVKLFSGRITRDRRPHKRSSAAQCVCICVSAGRRSTVCRSLDEISGANDRDFRHTPGETSN